MAKEIRIPPFLFKVKEPSDNLPPGVSVVVGWLDEVKTVTHPEIDGHQYAELETSVRQRLRDIDKIRESRIKYGHLMFTPVEIPPRPQRPHEITTEDGRTITVGYSPRLAAVGIGLTDEARQEGVPDDSQTWVAVLRRLQS